MSKTLTIYTDASGDNSTFGGISMVALVPDGFDVMKIKAQFTLDPNVPRMELYAIVKAMDWAISENYVLNKRRKVSAVEVFTDAEYIPGMFKTGLNKRLKEGRLVETPNLDLWEKLLPHKDYLTIKWVRAHEGDKWNSLADFFARSARENQVVYDI